MHTLTEQSIHHTLFSMFIMAIRQLSAFNFVGFSIAFASSCTKWHF